jgi:hypothetical protein
MELKKWTMIFATALLMASCSPAEQELKQDKADQNAKLMAADETRLSEDCLDARMILWFDAFNKFQNDGLNMEEADKKAAEIADKAYNDCIAGHQKLATETSVMEE